MRLRVGEFSGVDVVVGVSAIEVDSSWEDTGEWVMSLEAERGVMGGVGGVRRWSNGDFVSI